MRDIHQDKILVLDFGSQYTQLIARRIREIGVYCEILPYDAEEARITAFGARGIILSGGPESSTDDTAPKIPDVVLNGDRPILGICYGMQAMAQQLGGRVENCGQAEFGYASVQESQPNRLLTNLHLEADVDPTGQGGSPSSSMDVWMSHGDRVADLPPGYVCIASSGAAPLAAMMQEATNRYGIQFHPEVTHTRYGKQILRRFAVDICGCATNWTAGNIVDDAVGAIRHAVGDDEVILALSGGVDSSVVAALLNRAIGDRLTCVFVDNGLLRLHEGDQVMQTFADNLGVNVIRVDAEDRFLGALAGITDPEHKRKIIGNLFIEIFEEQANALSGIKWLAQGTIYPDVIESAGASTGKAHLIKSHHNVGGLPERMHLKLLEPLRELFKDEVRRVGLELGLPKSMVFRHPFPGPGLGVRILGEVRKEFADTLRLADDIYIRGLREHDLYDKVSQAFAVFLPVKSVGVTGDGRRYDHVVSLRAVETVDFMTARAARLPFDFLDRMSSEIINSIPGISRVTYDISSKPPATIEWE